MIGSLHVEQQVRASRDLTVGFMDAVYGTPTIKRGTRGIVVAVIPGGLFSGDRYTVEFSAGLFTRTVEVRARDVRAIWGAGGRSAWESRRQFAVGVRIGAWLVLALPMAWGLAGFFLRGGTVSELIAAAPGAILAVASGLMSRFGLGACALALVVLLAVRRLRGR